MRIAAMSYQDSAMLDFHKSAQLMVLMFHAFITGFPQSVIGPSLPDFQCLFGVNYETIEYLLLAYGLGAVTCQLFSVFLIKRIPTYLLLFICLVLLSGTFLTVSISGIFCVATPIMCVMGAVTELGLFGQIHAIHVIWPGTQRRLHLLFAVTSAGSVSIPLLLTPFLSDGVLTKVWNPSQIHQNLNLSSVTVRKEDNITESYSHKESKFTEESRCDDFTTLIQYPYLISSLLCVPVFLAELYLYWKSRTMGITSTYKDLDEKNTEKSSPSKIYLILMSVYLFNTQGFSPAFSFLLTTFGMQSSLRLSIGKLSMMTSLFWFSLLFGRLLSVFLPEGFKQSLIIFICLVGTSVGTGLLTAVDYGEIIMWTACVLLGLFSGPMVSAGLGWSSQKITTTPDTTALYMVAIACGFTHPYICMALMNTVGNQGFVFFFIGSLVLTGLSFAAIGLKENSIMSIAY